MKETYYVASWLVGEGEGISKLIYDKEANTLYEKEVYSDVKRSSYFARNNDILYVLTEGQIANPNTSCVSSFRMSENGLEPIAKSEMFASACPHVYLNGSHKHLYVSGYYSGALYIIDTDDSGNLYNLRCVYTNKGSSINRRQESSHLHFALETPDNDYLCVCDLGTDEVLVFKSDEKTGDLIKISSIKTPLGYGPRHMVFSPDGKYAYIICELNYHLLVCSYEGSGSLEFFDDIDLWPECPEDKRQCSALKISNDGKTLFTANRGEGYNSIDAFSLNDLSRPTKEATFTDLGFPRDFTILKDGTIAVCNQHGNSVQFLKYENKKFLELGKVEGIEMAASLIEY